MGKISSQGAKFYVQTGDLPAGAGVTSITKAKDPVATLAAAPPGSLVDGVPVIMNNTDWRTIEDKIFVADKIGTPTANDVHLKGADTSGETVTLNAGAKLIQVPFSEGCMVSLTFNRPAGTQIDATTLCDDARESLSGLPALATWQATGFWDKDDKVQSRFEELYYSGEKVAFECLWNDGSGLCFIANVSSYDVRAAVDQSVGFTLGGTITGKVLKINVAPSTSEP